MKTAPRTVTILRHAEKPDEKDARKPPFGVDENGQAQSTSLIPRGWQRAGALAAMFGAASLPLPFVRPTLLVAPAYADGLAHRPGETLAPLARRLGLQVRTPVPKGEEEALVSGTLLKHAAHDLLVCWEHHHIPAIVTALAAALGVNTLPANGQLWPDDDFSSVLVFAGQPSGGHTLTQLSMGLLDGD
ncbi:hypothetical protein Q0M94_08665 [Deinococcus radiomollis]|uniref:hypothetical protein n=1 Tax=Deinococcus radiomollis TaxID=468916 RepID=UPI003892AAE4